MSLIGNNWKEEPTLHEQYESVTGQKFLGNECELKRHIDREMEYKMFQMSKTERTNLRDLQSKYVSKT